MENNRQFELMRSAARQSFKCCKNTRHGAGVITNFVL